MAGRENPQAALELLILKTLAAGPNHGFGIALHVEETSAALRKRLKEIEESWATLTEGVRRVLRWA
jgi:hypothetical protein